MASWSKPDDLAQILKPLDDACTVTIGSGNASPNTSVSTTIAYESSEVGDTTDAANEEGVLEEEDEEDEQQVDKDEEYKSSRSIAIVTSPSTSVSTTIDDESSEVGDTTDAADEEGVQEENEDEKDEKVEKDEESTQEDVEEYKPSRSIAMVLERRASLAPARKMIKLFDCARVVPSMTIESYLERMADHFYCSDACFVLALVYIDRVMTSLPGFMVTSLNVHKLALASVLMAIKFHEDNQYSNSYYAKVGGVKPQELIRLERELLRLLDWRVSVEENEYSEYNKYLRTL